MTPKQSKHPDALPKEVSNLWLEETAAYLLGGERPSDEVLRHAAETLQSLASTGKRPRSKQQPKGGGRDFEVFQTICNLAATKRAKNFEEACNIAAEQLGLVDTREIKRSWNKVAGTIRPWFRSRNE